MSANIESIATKLNTETHSFSTLTLEEQAVLREALRSPPTGFTSEQRSLLQNRWLIIPPDIDVATLNQAHNSRISPATTTDGRNVCPAKLLTNIRPGEPYHWAAELLVSWAIATILPDEFPEIVPNI